MKENKVTNFIKENEEEIKKCLSIAGITFSLSTIFVLGYKFGTHINTTKALKQALLEESNNHILDIIYYNSISGKPAEFIERASGIKYKFLIEKA